LYEWIERAAFGQRLQEHRIHYLNTATGKRRALVLGDGDGRFVGAVTQANPDLPIDFVELSAGMLAQAKKRLAGTQRIHFINCDVFHVTFVPGQYDVLFTHFFLDCFDLPQVQQLVRHVAAALKPGAVWIVSDFKRGHSGWRKIYSGLWLNTMYLFFRLATGLTTRRLPEYSEALEAAGFRKREEWVSMAGLITSEYWQRI
jgi:ubiquinone/menaquinone biosynthesis C-methylase UbiE